MSNWQSIDFSNFLPPEVPQAIAQITSLIDKFLTIYKQSITAAKLYQSSLSGGTPDVLHTLVQALVDLIEGLLQAGKVHALFVPIPKHYPGPSPAAALAPTLDDLALELGFSFEEAAAIFSSGASTSYNQLIGQSGGNASFYRSFAQSLGDVFDENRPQYLSAGDAVTMTVMMLGAPTFSGLVEVASSFNRLFKPPANSDLTARMVPVPQNLRTTIVGLPKATGIGVRLDWSPPKPVYDSPYFPAVTTTVTKYAVIRCTDPKVAASAQTVLDFFSTRTLTEGLTSDDKAKVSKVIAVGSGSNASYVDDDASLDRDHTYFYCVAWQTSVEENGQVTVLNFDRVSNVVKTRVRAATPGLSTPPDWVAYGSMIDLVPELSVQVKTMLEQIKALADRQTGGAGGGVTDALDLVEKNIDAFATRLDDLNARVKRLAAAVAEPLPGLYSTTITGVGGNAFLMGELASRLQDTADTGRPPYDGDEYVLGVCLVAGGPRLPDIQPAVEFLASLFAPPKPKDPLYEVLAGIDDVLSVQEAFVFGPNLQALPKNTDGTVQIPAGTELPDGTTVPAGGLAIDPALIDPLTGLPAVTIKPVIGEDGTPVAADNPASPYTGDP